MSDDLMFVDDLLRLVDDEADEAAISLDAQLTDSTDDEPQSLIFLNDFLGNADISLESLDVLHPTVRDGTNATNIASNKTNDDGGRAVDGADESSTLLDELLIHGEELLVELAHDPEAHETTDLTELDDGSSPCSSGAREGGAASPSPSPSLFLDNCSILANTVVTISPAATREDSSVSLSVERPQDGDHETLDQSTSFNDEAALQYNVDLLGMETKYLSAQRDYLVMRAQSSRAGQRRAKHLRRLRENRDKSAKSSSDNTLITQLVERQRSYLDNFRAMITHSPVNDIRMALMTPIESYIHLGTEFNERRQTILGLREEKLDMTYKYIEEKARGINVDQPYRYSDAFERFGKYYSVHFAVSKHEGVDVSQVVKVVYDQMAGKDDSTLQAMTDYSSTRESYDSFKYTFLHQRIVSSLKRSEQFKKIMPDLESNSLFLCRFARDMALFITDYIDRDDLYPYLSKSRIRKDVSSGIVLTAHVDENNNKSVVMKKFQMTRSHMHQHKLSEKVSSILMEKVPAISEKTTDLVNQRLLESQDVQVAPS